MKHIFILTILLTLFCCNLYSDTWVELTSGVSVSLNSVSAIDDNNVWVCGNNGAVLRSTNGGTNWTNVTGAPIPGTLALTNIFGMDANTALVTGSTATATFVYRTSNAGTNWVQVFTQANGFIDAILMGNAVAGFMVGDPVPATGGRWSLWGTVNGGLTWDSTAFNLPQNGTEAGYNNCFYFDPVSQAVWFGTSNTRIYKSTNLILWFSQPTTGQINSYALWFNSSTNGMMGGTGMMFSSNAGTTWTATTSALPGTANVSGVTGSGTNWWVVRQASTVYFTANDGGGWSTAYTAPAGNYLHIVKSRSGAMTLYGVRNNGGISKGTNLLVGLVPVVSEVPKYFNLKQNYPNPFNPATKILFGIPAGSSNTQSVQLKVYDELGREVAILVNENLTPGTYEVNFDASNLSSGVYYYRLTAGSYSESKKMSILK